MRTVFKATFKLVGFDVEADVALANELQPQRDALIENMESLATAALPPIVWEDSFPTGPEDRLLYRQIITKSVAPAALRTAAEAIALGDGSLIKTREDTIAAATQDRLVTAEITPFSQQFSLTPDSSYDFRQAGPSLCIPCDPPPDCHIAKGELYVVRRRAAASSFVFSFLGNGNVFSYTLECTIAMNKD